MDDPWIWAVLLLTLGMGLAILEVFFPSAGILGFLAASSILAAIVLGFRQGPLVGFAILLVALVGLPAVVVMGLKYWPRTAMGRRVMLMSPRSEDVLPDHAGKRHLKSLVGKVGRARCEMLPSGVIAIDGRTVDAVSEGMPIAEGREVRVIAVRGTWVVVRALEEGEAPAGPPEDVLKRPIESVADDPFKDSPA